MTLIVLIIGCILGLVVGAAHVRGRSSQIPRSPAREVDEEDWGALARVIYISVGLILFALLIYLANLEFVPRESPAHEPLVHIAIAFFVIGCVSLLIEYRDFTDYATRQLSKIVVKGEYLKKMGIPALERLSERIAEVTYGSPEIVSEGSFYKFVDKQFRQSLRSPYREDFREYVHLEDHTKFEDAYRKSVVTQYCFRKGFSTAQKMTIPWQTRVEVCGKVGKDIVTYFERVELNISGKDLWGEDFSNVFVYEKVQVEGEEHKEIPCEAGPFAVLMTAGAGNKHKNMPTFTIRRELERGKPYAVASFTYDVPETENPGHDYCIRVTIRENTTMSKFEPFTFLEMALPTKNLTATYVFPAGTRTYVAPFAMDPNQVNITDVGDHVADVTIGGWVLSGHGTLVRWVPA